MQNIRKNQQLIEDLESLDAAYFSKSEAFRDLFANLRNTVNAREIAALATTLSNREEERFRRYIHDEVLRSAHLPALSETTLKLLQWAQLSRLQIEKLEGPDPSIGVPKRKSIPIDLSKVVATYKISDIEYDMRRLGLSVNAILDLYEADGREVEDILLKHNQQVKARELARAHFGKDRVIDRDLLTEEHVKEASLLVALGGDNHAQFASHFIQDDTPIMMVNSDPKKSKGYLLSCDVDTFIDSLAALEAGEYRLEPWTRLKVSVDGVDLGPVIGDVYIGRDRRKHMSRHLLEHGGESLEQLSSGMLIATGVGSTGWIKNAGRYLYPMGNIFPKTAPYARFLLTETAPLSMADEKREQEYLVYPPCSEGVLLPGEKMIIKSLNKKDGIVCRDSLNELPFPSGSVVTIELAKEPLWVIENQHQELRQNLFSEPKEQSQETDYSIRALNYLEDRSILLKKCIPHFKRVASVISNVYSTHLGNMDASSAPAKLPPGLTRYIYSGLLSALPSEIQMIWHNTHLDGLKEESEMLKVFGWSFNRMKRIQEEVNTLAINIIERDCETGSAAPYPVHTHIDVPFAMHSFGLGRTKLAIALAACHDALEEGNHLYIDQERPKLKTIDLKQLKSKFPSNALGEQLAIGIDVLTESSYQDISASINNEALSEHKDSVQSILEANLVVKPTDPKVIEKVHYMDPFVYGSLALQIRETINVLMTTEAFSNQLSDKQIRQLANSILEVEIGDRLSDIATLERYLDWNKDRPELGRHKILCMISRMLNMHEKIEGAANIIKGAEGENLALALKSYLCVLTYKIEEINKELERLNLDPFSSEEIQHFHTNVSGPIQEKADKLMALHVKNRINSLVHPTTYDILS